VSVRAACAPAAARSVSLFRGLYRFRSGAAARGSFLEPWIAMRRVVPPGVQLELAWHLRCSVSDRGRR